jgi:hypothetical protein
MATSGTVIALTTPLLFVFNGFRVRVQFIGDRVPIPSNNNGFCVDFTTGIRLRPQPPGGFSSKFYDRQLRS